MTIDTNGFEICDEVWHMYFEELNFVSPSRFKINSFLVAKLGVMARGIYGGKNNGIMVNCLYHTQQECQIACDELNGKIENENSKSFFHFQKVFE